MDRTFLFISYLKNR